VVVQRVMFRNNIVRHTAGGVNILGTDNLAPSQRTRDITVVDNLFEDLTASIWGAAKVFLIGDGPDNVTINHNMIVSTQPSIYYLYGGPLIAPTPITNLTITNNLSTHNSFGFFGDRFSSGLVAFNAYMLLLARAPAALASSYTFVNPVIAMLLGVAVAGETVTPFEWGAVSVVLAGVLLLLWRRSRS